MITNGTMQRMRRVAMRASQHCRIIALLLGAIVAPLSFAPAALVAQIEISGRVVDSTGVAVSDIEVVLHRVSDAGGARLAEGRTIADGSFTLRADGDAVEGNVYFVAARLGEHLYIGPFLRPPLPATPYVVALAGQPMNVGSSTSSNPAPMGVEAAPTSSMRPQVRPPASPRRWWLMILPAIGLTVVAFLMALRARGPSSRRRLLIRIAELDLAAEGGDVDAAGERQRLVERLVSGED
jgi:hypothetical protein